MRGMEYEPIVCAKYDGKAAVTGILQTNYSVHIVHRNRYARNEFFL